MINVVIADDHAIVRRGLRQVLSEESDLKVAGEAEDGPALLKLLDKVQCDVLVLDINMPGRGGLDILKEIKQSHPRLPVLILSVHPEDQYAVRTLRAGAAGYMTKESAPEELVRAIRKLRRGGKYVSASLAERLVMQLDIDYDKPLHARLSDREFQILRLIASGRTLSEIADQLSLSPKTVSTYRARVLEKMGMENNAQLTHYVIEQGLVS